jgi:hypothetical protein
MYVWNCQKRNEPKIVLNLQAGSWWRQCDQVLLAHLVGYKQHLDSETQSGDTAAMQATFLNPIWQYCALYWFSATSKWSLTSPRNTHRYDVSLASGEDAGDPHKSAGMAGKTASLDTGIWGVRDWFLQVWKESKLLAATFWWKISNCPSTGREWNRGQVYLWWGQGRMERLKT